MGVCKGIKIVYCDTHSMNMVQEEKNTLLSSSDCDYIQGWYYSKAFPLEECEAFVDRYDTV